MYVPVATPDSEAELSTMVSVLSAFEIPHFVHNRHFGGLYPGNPFPLYTLQRILVPVPHVEAAKELLSPFFGPPLPFETERRLHWSDRVRGVIEFFVGGWVVGCKRWRPRQTGEDS